MNPPGEPLEAPHQGVDAFILNREGRYQNIPRLGSVLARAPMSAIEPHQGVREIKL